MQFSAEKIFTIWLTSESSLNLGRVVSKPQIVQAWFGPKLNQCENTHVASMYCHGRYNMCDCQQWLVEKNSLS